MTQSKTSATKTSQQKRTEAELQADLQAQRERLKLLEEEARLQEGLPHLFGFPWYDWAYDFFHSVKKQNFLCAANQISKSSTQIRKAIHWATEPELWPELWPMLREGKHPTLFWYMYPSQQVVEAEFETKWAEFLPSGEYKNHPQYGWKVLKKHKDIIGIRFNTGVMIHFKTYSQRATVLQSSTLYAIFCDEELPEDLYDELMLRLTATDGYFHMVFTATLGQEMWRKTIEPMNSDEELFPGAWKKQVSMYDCLRYKDGRPGPWTPEKIERVKARCKNHAEVLRRVYGRFILESGRKYGAFDAKKHVKEWHTIPKNWLIYAGIDSGAGGKRNHPAAICFVAVSPDYQKGRVFLGWRGEQDVTTSGDVLEKFTTMVTENKLNVTDARYDWADKDFDILATRAGIACSPAEKGQDLGERMINVLFRNNMLMIYATEELQKLVGELISLRVGEHKSKAKDDFSDALRYAITSIPWDWSIVTADPAMDGLKIEKKGEPEDELTPMEKEVRERRRLYEEAEKAEKDYIESEFAEWNTLYG